MSAVSCLEAASSGAKSTIAIVYFSKKSLGDCNASSIMSEDRKVQSCRRLLVTILRALAQAMVDFS